MIQFILTYSVVQALVLSIWLFITPKKGFLSLFYLSLGWLIFIYLFETSGWYLEAPHLIWTNVPIWFIIAPLLYLHNKDKMGAHGGTLEKRDLLHFLPALAFLLYIFPFYVMSGDVKIERFTGFYSAGNRIDYIQLLYLTQILIYIAIGYVQSGRWIASLRSRQSDSTISDLAFNRKLFALLFMQVCAALIITLIIAFNVSHEYIYYQISFLLLAAIITFSTFNFLNKGVRSDRFLEYQRTDEVENQNVEEESAKYASSSLDKEQMTVILNKMDTTMVVERLFTNRNLKLNELSKHLGIPGHHISQSLNQVRDINFFQYVNDFRVDEMKARLRNSDHKTKTIAAIAEECGFKSQSSFYRIFKQRTGNTPGVFAENLKDSD